MAAVFFTMASDPQYDVLAMLKLEFARNDAHFLAVMQEYGYSEEWLEMMIYMDFAFLVTFSAIFYFSLKLLMAAGKVKRRSFLGLFCLLPGLLDVVENILMLQIINHGWLGEQFQHFINVVWMKWIIVIPFILLSLVAVRHQVLRLFSSTTAEKPGE